MDRTLTIELRAAHSIVASSRRSKEAAEARAICPVCVIRWGFARLCRSRYPDRPSPATYGEGVKTSVPFSRPSSFSTAHVLEAVPHHWRRRGWHHGGSIHSPARPERHNRGLFRRSESFVFSRGAHQLSPRRVARRTDLVRS